jgi:hypothetical protein
VYPAGERPQPVCPPRREASRLRALLGFAGWVEKQLGCLIERADRCALFAAAPRRCRLPRRHSAGSAREGFHASNHLGFLGMTAPVREQLPDQTTRLTRRAGSPRSPDWVCSPAPSRGPYPHTSGRGKPRPEQTGGKARQHPRRSHGRHNSCKLRKRNPGTATASEARVWRWMECSPTRNRAKEVAVSAVGC